MVIAIKFVKILKKIPVSVFFTDPVFKAQWGDVCTVFPLKSPWGLLKYLPFWGGCFLDMGFLEGGGLFKFPTSILTSMT